MNGQSARPVSGESTDGTAARLWALIGGVLVAAVATAHCTRVSTVPWQRHVIDASSLGADGVRAGDVNDDGVPDLVASWEQGGLTRAYLGNRHRSGSVTWQTITVGTSRDAEDALFFDADGDGAMDVVSSTEGTDRRILVHWAPAKARYGQADAWKTQVLFADGSRWMYAVPMDVDGRHGTDLIIGGKDEGASIGWLEAPPTPRDEGGWRFHRISPVGWTMALAVRDMNGDGLADIVCSDRRGPLAGLWWLENPGRDLVRLRMEWTRHWIGAHGREAMFFEMSDIDGDGAIEIVLPHYLGTDRRISIFRRPPVATGESAWTEEAVPYPKYAGMPKAVAAGDIDLDGRVDLVLATEHARNDLHGIVWLRSAASSARSAWQVLDVSGTEGVKFDQNLLLDVDGDGDLDVVNSEENDDATSGPGLGVVWYENPVLKRTGEQPSRSRVPFAPPGQIGR